MTRCAILSVKSNDDVLIFLLQVIEYNKRRGNSGKREDTNLVALATGLRSERRVVNVLLDHGAVMQDIDEFRLTLAEEIFKLSSPLFDGTLLEVSGRPFKDAYKILCCIRLSRLQSEQIAPSLHE